MQLVRKKVKGHTYWYLVEKGRKNGVVTNVKTIYLGKADRVAQLLREAEPPLGDFPKGFRSREMGGSAALWSEASALSLVELIDRACGPRRSDASISYGELFVVAAIQHAIAPRALKSAEKLRAWFEGAGLSELASVEASGLDARRVHEALALLRASDIERVEEAVVKEVVRLHSVSVETLAFDATNFDSYVAARNGSRLLRRGNAKSKRNNLRLLGMGLLVSADNGLPLLSFVYPGNRADVTSFKSFLRRLRKRSRALGIGANTTLVCDGGNISKDVIHRLDEEHFKFAARLPTGHAPDVDEVLTEDLEQLGGRFAGKVRAKKLTTKVYGKDRTVIATYSASMHESQLPGLERDIKKVKNDLAALQDRLRRQKAGKSRGRPLTRETAQTRADKVRERQYMKDLFWVSVGGTDAAPSLRFGFRDGAWENLAKRRLGRTAIITNQDEWTCEQTIDALRTQSVVEEAFKHLIAPAYGRHATHSCLHFSYRTVADHARRCASETKRRASNGK